MNLPISIGALVVGIVLIAIAFVSGDSVSSGFSELFQGTPDNRTIIFGVLGLLALVVGIVGLARGARRG